MREFLVNCSTVTVICVHHIVDPQGTCIVEIRNHIQTLVQLGIGRVIIVIGCTKACLIGNPEFCTFLNLTLYHNVHGFTGIGIKSGRVVHVTMCIDAQVACNLTLDTVGLIHLHTELLGVVTTPLWLAADSIGLAPVIVLYLEHHSLQHSRESLVIGIGFYLANTF